MSKSKKKYVKGQSPVGKFQWFKLITPDEKYKKYTVDLVVEDSEALQKMISKIDSLIEEKIEEETARAKEAKKMNLLSKIVKGANFPIVEEYNKDGEKTGRYIIKFRVNAIGKDKSGKEFMKQPPVLFDENAKVIKGDTKAKLQVWNGSEGLVSYLMVPYFVPSLGVGVSLRPKAAQIIVLKNGEASEDAEDYGFESFGSDDEEDSESEEFSSEEDDDEDF